MEAFPEIQAPDGALKFFLDGAWKVSESGSTVSVLNPQTNEAAFKVQACTQKEVDAAYDGAQEAQRQWRITPLWKRAEYLHKVAECLRKNADAIAPVLVAEVAKPTKASRTEIVRSAELISYCAEEGVRFLGQGKVLNSDSFPGTDRNKLCLASKVPLGVVLCIPPFNYPVNLAVSKIAPALMAGNAVVLKTPTQGAASGVCMAAAFAQAGLPAGLLQVITGKGSTIGDYLTQHPKANCISFTGGDTGLKISARAGMIPLQMELGGKDVCVVCADADLDLAAKSIVKGGLSYQGQRCTAVKIVAVVDAVADELVGKVKAQVEKLTVGRPEDDCDVCHVISSSSADWIKSLVKDAEQKGAKLLGTWQRDGNLIHPLLIDHVTAEMQLAFEEQFGPVLPIMRVKDAQAGIDHCNASRLALQGCVFTQDVNEAVRISDAMQTGTVQVNGAPARGPDHFPFQGFRDSGIGSQGIVNSLNMMCKDKTTVINMPAPSYTLG